MKSNFFIKTVTVSLFTIMTLTCCSKISNENLSDENSMPTDVMTDTDKTREKYEFRFMNYQLDFPFKIEELDGVKFDEETCFECDDGTSLFGAIWFKDCRLGTVRLNNCKENDNKYDKEVVYLKIGPDFEFDEFDFEYNELTFNSTKEDIIKTLGESEVDNQLTYMIDENTKINFKISDNIIYRVTISSCNFDE